PSGPIPDPDASPRRAHKQAEKQQKNKKKDQERDWGLTGPAPSRMTLGGAAASLALSTGLPQPWGPTAQPARDYPFTLGVASGDPLPDSVVLWTRLAPRPLEPLGAMANAKTPVRWEIAQDEQFSRVVDRGTSFAHPEFGHSVHVDVRGLEPGREYFYRFATGSEVSPVGRTMTAPGPRAARRAVAGLRLLPGLVGGLLHRLRRPGRERAGCRLPPR
ncbi:alkaline phosphatase D family protein, partial [Pseudonocardia nigra]|uniref:alkaline phosphatase D family protein n=1 Tax=Pseudonocardia nigra TaxID=1921578 RepID=UPI001FE4672B